MWKKLKEFQKSWILKVKSIRESLKKFIRIGKIFKGNNKKEI